MRSEIKELTSGLSHKWDKTETLAMFEKFCDIRYFEYEVKKAYDKDIIHMPVYLSIGQEAISSSLAVVLKKFNPAIFAQHRAHGMYISFGGNLDELRDEILHKGTGCAKGMGGSASIHSPAIRMYGHDGLMGTQVPIGVGHSYSQNYKANKKDYSIIVMGDASAEEDYVLGALGYAAHKKLPILFICEDNNLSILTEIKVRRNWKIVDVAKSFGMTVAETVDDPWSIMSHAKNLSNNLPAFLNIHTARSVWHAGTGSDGPPEWDRFDLIKKDLDNIGLKKEAEEIENNSKEKMEELWKTQL
ncbi:MAG: thiamine pyrophosphate-dependent enzyme [Nanoarchaeota archaeon]|nr:thiamine pyrophosphate-dependent enzyme [Nanoarchaeota archaeon]